MKKFLALSICVLSLYADIHEDNNIRYYGGYSQNEVLLVKSKTYTAPIVVTEKIFNAKSSADIDKVIQTQQNKDISMGISAKEFLKERTGHLYGGYSESALKLHSQQ